MRHNMQPLPKPADGRPLVWKLAFLATVAATTCFSSQESEAFDVGQTLPHWQPLLRAGMWPELKSALAKDSDSQLGWYALGRAHSSDKPAQLDDAVAAYLSAVRGKTVPAKGWTEHLAKIPDNSVQGFIGRLSLYNASTELKDKGRAADAYRVSTKADPAVVDPLSLSLLYIRVETGKDHSNNLKKDAQSWATWLGEQEKTPFALFRRAQSLRMSGDMTASYQAYRDFVDADPTNWLLKAGWRDFKEPELDLRKLSIWQQIRISRYYPAKDRLSAMSPGALGQAQACPVAYISDCAELLYKSTSAGAALKLLRKRQPEILANPDAIEKLVSRLSVYKDGPFLSQVFKLVRAQMHKNTTIWNRYLQYLQRVSPYDYGYFQEMVRYTAENSSRFNYDRVMPILIHYKAKKSLKPRYAPERYWQFALKNLVKDSLKGRLYYWRYRQLKDRGKHRKAAYYENEFHRLAPNSYFNRAFWEKNKHRQDFKSEFAKVKDYPSFQTWLTHFGGREDAVSFVRSQNIAAYRNAGAQKLFTTLWSAPDGPLPAKTQLLYALGELTMGSKYYDFESSKKKNSLEYHIEKFQLGQASGQKYISLWHLRKVMAKMGVEIDPFSMPEELLKAIYPRPYRNWVRTAASRYGTEEHKVYALMWQESHFREMAISRSNAQGLMQVMPATGRWLAKKMGLGTDYNLLHPQTSITLGSKFIADLLRSQDSFEWMAVAYNGGPGNLRKWKKRYYRGDFYYFLELIPYREPSNYSRITTQNLYNYDTIYALYP